MPPRQKRAATTRLARYVMLLLFASVFVLTLFACTDPTSSETDGTSTAFFVHTPTYAFTLDEISQTVTAIIATATWQEGVNRTLTADPNAFTPTDTSTPSPTLPPQTGTAQAITQTAISIEWELTVTALLAEDATLEAQRTIMIQTANASVGRPPPQAFATPPA